MNQEASNYLMDSNEEFTLPKRHSVKLLSGESIQFIGQCAEGQITLTNYKLILQYTESIYHIPLGVIEQTELKKVFCLHILCKDARIYKCTFSTSEICLDWQKRINDATVMPLSIEKFFAFTYYHNSLIESPELHHFFSSQIDGTSSYTYRSDKIFNDEVKRLGFDIVGAWRISLANESYKLCPSYPRKIIVPSSISDASLEGVAKFRSSRRIPTVVWRHPNGAVIARSSQPEVGWLGWRSTEDEDLIKAISEACAYDSPSSNQSSSLMSSSSSSLQNQNECLHSDQNNGKSDNSLAISDLSSICDLPEAKPQTDIKKLLVMDARSYATAVANRARGGGCECLDYYPMCEIQFMNLDNIHTIRKAQQALRCLDSVPPDAPNWLSLLENTRWLYHISGLIRAAVIVAQTISVEARPVLVHCSDGWDRTPQITALAEILLDPYYRTLEGFQVLVEREWIEFGHKFSDRNGCGVGSEDLNERCPVFLQWIDCVHQIMNQFPTMFQFNQAYLVKLAQHVYSNLFGTFLFNSSQERYLNEQQHGKSIPYSVWPLFRLHQHRYINYLYSHSSKVLLPAYNLKDLVFWKAVYVSKLQEEKSLNSEETINKKKVEEPPIEGELVKTKSCDNLVSLSMDSSSNSLGTRRLSDSNLKDKDSPTNMDLLKSALGSDAFEESSVSHLEKDSNATKGVEHNIETTPESGVSASYSVDVQPFQGSEENNGEIVNGNPKLFIEEEEYLEEVGGKETHLQRAKREIDKRSIEGSTDTLVSEVGVLTNEEPSNCIQVCSQEKKTSTVLEQHLNGVKCVEEKKFPKSSFRNLNTEERKSEETQFSHSIVTSTVAACSTCLKNRKGQSDNVEIDMWKPSTSDDVIQTPAVASVVLDNRFHKGAVNMSHSASNSSCIPSTPNEDRYLAHPSEKILSSPFSDGLSNYKDDITRRLNEMRVNHQTEVEQLRRELQVARSFIIHLMHSKSNQVNGENHTEDQVSLPESVGSGSGDSIGPESSVLSDGSWENLEDLRPTILWYPDHAVDSCMGCHSRFWMGRRKHHCRSCGKIFCAECSGNSVPIPRENLFEPVRVCGNCFSSLLEFRPKDDINEQR